MKRIIIFGNSGSGKSTLAKKVSVQHKLGHLDLDTLAWQNTSPPQRMPIEESQIGINKFLEKNDNWVIEGCYSDLIKLVIPLSTKIIFMDLSIDECVKNASNREWEPHKYSSKEEQDKNLSMLIDWIRNYNIRTDTFSRESHSSIFELYSGDKIKVCSNKESLNWDA